MGAGFVPKQDKHLIISVSVLTRLKSYKKILLCVNCFLWVSSGSVESCSIVTGYDYLKFTARC